MSSLSISNCKNCNKPFRMMSRDICSACIELEEARIKQLKKRLRDSEAQGGVDLETLCQEVGMEQEALIELLAAEGSCGMAVSMVKVSCLSCGESVPWTKCQGRLCRTCASQMAEEGKFELKSQKEIAKEEAHREMMATLKPKPSTEPVKHAFHSNRGR